MLLHIKRKITLEFTAGGWRFVFLSEVGADCESAAIQCTATSAASCIRSGARLRPQRFRSSLSVYVVQYTMLNMPNMSGKKMRDTTSIRLDRVGKLDNHFWQKF